MSTGINIFLKAAAVVAVASTINVGDAFAGCTGGYSMDGCITAAPKTYPVSPRVFLRNYPNIGPGVLIEQMGNAIDREFNHNGSDDDDNAASNDVNSSDNSASSDSSDDDNNSSSDDNP